MTINAFKIAIERIMYSGIDIIITVIGLITVIFIFALAIKKRDYRNNEGQRPKKAILLMANLYQWGIDVCPLLGTLGTVVALIVNTGSNGGEELKANFMYALTSTLWGLFWSVLCKFAESVTGVEGYYETLAEERKSE